MTKTELKKRAQDMIMQHLSGIGYGDMFQDFVDLVGDQEEAEKIVIDQMNRIAKIMGYKAAWYS